jgi:adenine deaminase
VITRSKPTNMKSKAKLRLVAQPRTMDISTVYYRGKLVVKANRASRANNAVPRAVAHMQINRYQASVAEVFDLTTGELHAVIRRAVSGDIHIVFKREVKEGM